MTKARRAHCPLATLLQSGAVLALQHGWRAIRGGQRARAPPKDNRKRQHSGGFLNTFLDTVGSRRDEGACWVDWSASSTARKWAG